MTDEIIIRVQIESEQPQTPHEIQEAARKVMNESVWTNSVAMGAYAVPVPEKKPDARKVLTQFMVDKGFTFSQAMEALDECKAFIFRNFLLDAVPDDLLKNILRDGWDG